MSTDISATLHTPPATGTREESDRLSGRQKLWRAIARSVPNLAVFFLLGGIFYFGHHTGWQFPKSSTLMGSAPARTDDWCSEHLIPESQCIECNDDLVPKWKEFGFCRIHGVAECVICHPELAEVVGQPQLPKYDTARALNIMVRQKNNSRNTLHKRRVQFASAGSVTKAGVEVDVVQERPMVDFVTANGELTFDPTRIAHLSTKVTGTVAVVVKTLGDTVRAGEVLALVDAAQVGAAKSNLLSAIVQSQLRRSNVERLREAQNAVSGKTVIDAEAALQEAEIALISARQALANLGFELPEKLDGQDAKQLAEEIRFLNIPKSQISALPAGTKTANLIALKSPFEGVIVAADIVAGEMVSTTSSLYTVANPKHLWLILNVRQEDSKYVEPGLPVNFQTDDGAKEVTGRIAWISPAIDELTRTLRVRVTLENNDGRLRDKTFGTGRIVLREEPHAIVVPREAVQSTADANFVFVRDCKYFDEKSPKFFHVRQVRIGARNDGYVELLAGVLPGEVVATKGSPVLLAQLLRSNLGAGCGCHEH